jgi:GNAT superfamily N-acetyltransferase
LLEFISRIWGGQDYIPKVLDRWIRERRARTFVVEIDGTPVGMNRVNFLEDGSAWFEGVRVHPRYRGQGLAGMLGRNGIRVARDRGVRILRLTTGSRNAPSRRQIPKMGFREVSRMSLYVPRERTVFRRQPDVQVARAKDVPRTVKLILSSLEFEKSRGMHWEGFRAVSLTPRIIRRRVLEGSVYLCGDSVAVAKRVEEGGEVFRQVCFACGRTAGVTMLIEHIFSMARRNANENRILCAPQRSSLINIARGAGLVRWSSYILYERRLPKG